VEIEATELLSRPLRLEAPQSAGPTKRRRGPIAAAVLAASGLTALGWARGRPANVIGPMPTEPAPEPAPEALGAASATPLPASAVDSSAPDPAAPPRAPSSRRTTHAGPNCSPPWIIDANGHLKYKKECFSR
jgi:serine/threonine-protein kinase